MTVCPDSKMGNPCEPVCALCGGNRVAREMAARLRAKRAAA